MKVIAMAMRGFIRAYQYTLAAIMGGQCRFHPSCSEYAIEAIDAHGPFKGFWLGLRRIVRCNPWGGSGYDPVPPAGRTARQPR
jgi:putative membrane protein insertion efficiency factor